MNSYITTLNENTLYLLKIQLININCNQQKAKIKLDRYCDLGTSQHLVETESFTLQINQAAVPTTENSSWYEQTLFIETNKSVNKIEVHLIDNLDVSLIVRCSAVNLTVNSMNGILKFLPAAMRKKTVINNKKYRLIKGIDTAKQHLHHISSQLKNACHPILTGKLKLTNNHLKSSYYVGLIGNQYLREMLDTSFNCVMINRHNTAMITANIFDVIILQTGYSSIIEDYATPDEQEAYLTLLGSTLQNTQSPIIELRPNDDCTEYDSTLIPKLNCHVKQAMLVNEFEITNFLSLGENTSLNKRSLSILIPCSTDLFHNSAFLDVTTRLAQNNVLLCVAETNYKTNLHQVLQLFNSELLEKIKAYDQLSAVEYIELCRLTPFVLLAGNSRNSQQNINNLCAIAIVCGAIPIVFGNKLNTKLGDIVKSVKSFSELFDFVMQFFDHTFRDKQSLILFRKFNEIRNSGLFSAFLGSIIHKTSRQATANYYPAAEMIAISNRPENVKNIIDSFYRQSYPNLKLHLILNMANKQQKAYQQIIDTYQNTSTIRISMMNQNYNIGSCLNYGINTSPSNYWFKIDDDDYYGKYYIEDMVNWYKTTGVDVMGKPPCIIFSESSQQMLLRAQRIRYGLSTFTTREQPFWIAGNSLSGKINGNVPYFSSIQRNSCDANWVNTLKSRNYNMGCGDLFNLIIRRKDPENHTWRAPNSFLTKGVIVVSNFEHKGWCDAE